MPGVLIQQSRYIAVHAAGLGQIIDGHILLQFVQNAQGYVPQGIQLGFAQVKLAYRGGQGIADQIYQYHRRHCQHGQYRGG